MKTVKSGITSPHQSKKMNNTFNLHRFGSLLKKQIIENRIEFLLASFAMAGILTFLYGYLYFESSPSVESKDSLFEFSKLAFRSKIFLAVGILFLTVIPGHYFIRLSNPAKSTQELTLPVSTLETTLSSWLLAVIGIILVYLLVFIIIDTAFILLLRKKFEGINYIPHRIDQSTINYGFQSFFANPSARDILPVTAIYTIIPFCFLIGSVFSKRWHYLTTLAFLLLIYGSFIVLNQTYHNEFLKDKVRIDPVLYQQASTGTSLLLLLFSNLALGSLLYFRLKEKEA